MTPFPLHSVSLLQAEGGRTVLMAECAFGLAIVPVREVALRMAAVIPQRDAPATGGDRLVRGTGFTLYHASSGRRLLPQGWFFRNVGDARAGLALIGDRWPDAFEGRGIGGLDRMAGPVLEALREKTAVVAGKWNDLSRALDGVDEDAWKAGHAARLKAMERMAGKALPNPTAAAMRGAVKMAGAA